jgi:hypothetical protein
VPVQGNISANEASTLMRGDGRCRSGDAADLSGGRAHAQRRAGPPVAGAEPRQMNMYAVYASRKHMPAALRSLLDFLV